MIYLLCFSLFVLSLFLTVRLLLLHKSIDEICEELSDILGTDTCDNFAGVRPDDRSVHTNDQGVSTNDKDIPTNVQGIPTNALITISSRDRRIRRLAVHLNRQLARLRSRQLQYENGDRELKEAITNISHDLRTPLTAMSGYLELLQKELSGDALPKNGSPLPVSAAEKSARYLAILQNRMDTMKQMTEELFRYSIILSAREENPERLSLNRILEECLMVYWNGLEQRKITPVISMPPQPVKRTLDASSLSRIFTNILSNAVKYSDGDLRITLTEDGTVTFSNHTAGLTPVMVEKLFDRFYTIKSVNGSTGLGLSIARLLTERMGGSIDAACKEGELHITVQFPQKT